jgi:ATP synthase protein I
MYIAISNSVLYTPDFYRAESVNSNPLQRIVQQQAFSIVYWQTFGVIALALITWAIFGIFHGMSVLYGGLAYCLPNLLFVWRVFRYSGAKQMNQFMAAFFLGEMIKLILSGILFLLVVKYWSVSLLSMLVGFVGAIVLFWIVSIWRFARQTNKRNNNST